MKRYWVIVVLIMLTSTVWAQRYDIFKCSDGVMIKYAVSSDWKSANRRDNVDLADMVQIPEGGLLVIHEISNNRLYKSTGSGEFTVKEFIDAAKAEAANIVKLLNNEIAQRKNAGGGQLYSSVGAVVRGDAQAENMRYDSLCSALLYAAQQTTYKGSGQLNVVAVESGDGEVNFEFSNNGETPLFVNILRFDKISSKYNLCYVFEQSHNVHGIIVDGGGNCRVEEFAFAMSDNDNYIYIPFGTTEPFDSKMLQLLIQRGSKTKVKKIKASNVVIGTALSFN